MGRLVWAFGGRTYHIVGNLMSLLICFLFSQVFGALDCLSLNKDQMTMKNYSVEEVIFSLKIDSKGPL